MLRSILLVSVAVLSLASSAYAGNSSSIVQNGNGNGAQVNQRGRNNNAGIGQNGDFNFGEVNQRRR